LEKIEPPNSKKRFRNFVDKYRQHTYIEIMKLYTLYLTEPQLETLKAMARKSGGNVSEIIRRAVDEYVERKREQRKAK